MARKPGSPKQIDALRHGETTRRNIPTAEMESFFRREEDRQPLPPKHYPRARPLTEGEIAQCRFHYDDHDQLRRHLADFVAAYNFGLKGLTPYEFICKRWTTEPDRFNLNPLQQMPGLNT